jgi:DNA-directed RNA polymerase specialized sigma24 family protein
MKTEWPPSAEAFEAFLAWLSPQREEAGNRFEQIKNRLIKFFAQGGCPVSDELFYETVARAARQIHVGGVKPDVDPTRYCYGVARNVLREYWKIQHPVWLIPPAPDNDAELECLGRCMNRLPPHDRDLFSRYYKYDGRRRIEERKRLAEEEGGENAVRIKVFRIRQKLRLWMADCLGQSNWGPPQ